VAGGLLFGYFFESKYQADEIDYAVGFVGGCPAGEEIVEAVMVAGEGVDLGAFGPTESEFYEAGDLLHGDGFSD
jgi:hypothetical protein